MSFYNDSWTQVENWEENDESQILKGHDTEVGEEIDFDGIIEGSNSLMYEGTAEKYEPNDPEKELRGDGKTLEDGGTFYSIELGENLFGEYGKLTREEMTHEQEGELFEIHMTGYRDPEGNDYLIHSDPGVWTPEGKKKLSENPPGRPLTEGEDKFTVENNYEFTEGLKQVESYLTDIADREGGMEGLRWEGLGRAVKSFRKSYETDRPIDLET